MLGRPPRRLRLAAVALAVGAPLAACSSEDPTEVPVARVRVGTVDEIVRVPAHIDAARVLPVTTPAPGTVAELFVRNGAHVVAGQPVMRVESPMIDQLLAQTRTAASAPDACAAVRGSGRSRPRQPPATAALDQLEAAFGEVLASVARARDALAGSVSAPPERPDLPPFPVLPPLPQFPAGPDLVPLPDVPALPDLPTFPDVPQPGAVPTGELVADLVTPELDRARAQLQTSRDALERATGELSAGVASATTALRAALESTRASVAAAQRAADEAQQTARAVVESVACGPGAERSVMLDDIRQRLLVRAPADGIVVFGGPAAAGPSLGGGGDSLLGDLAPLFAGTTQTRLAEDGQVGIGQVLFTLYDVSTLVAVADFDESQVADLVEGARATVVVESAEDTLDGTLTFVSPVKTGGTDQPLFRGEVVIDDPTGDNSMPVSTTERPPVPLGTTAQLDVHLRSVGPGTIVPESALLRDGDTTLVYVLDDGRAQARQVRVRGSDGTNAAVEADDLDAGERVILAPRTVEDGERVRS